MIYLKNIAEAQTISIPRNGGGDGESPLSMLMWNTIDRSGCTIDVTLAGLSEMYFGVSISLPDDLPDGEYEYTLKQGGIAISCGLMIIGEPEEPSEYNKHIEYEQYGE